MARRMSQQFRTRSGGHIDRSRTLHFRFDGRNYEGHPGDTLASALLANGVRLVGRSFKLHRPRGVFAAGAEEPNALAEMRTGGRREPNTRMTMIELYDRLEAASQNRFPSLRFDIMSTAGLAAPLLAAGFYYKTFMWPPAFWEKLYEPVIRRAAGLGRASGLPDPDRYEAMHAHCDVLVVGSGAAGLAAARVAGAAGARVILCEQDFVLGGGLLAERLHEGWREQTLAALAAMPEVTLLPRTTVFGHYDHNMLGAVERVADHLPEPPPHTPRQRYWTIRARSVVLATGAHERFIAFPNNDRPGVMLAGAAQTYATRFGTRPGRRVLLFANNDAAYDSLFALQDAEMEIAGAVDARADSPGIVAARERGIAVWTGASVTGTAGRLSLRNVRIRNNNGDETRVAADLLCVSGGINPAVHLASQSGTPLIWDDRLASFVPGDPVQVQHSAGAAAGITGIAAAAADGARAGAAAAATTGFVAANGAGAHTATTASFVATNGARARAATATAGLIAANGARADAPTTTPGFVADASIDLPAGDAPDPTVLPLWEVKASGKAFVDIQDDVTTEDIRLAWREGYRHIEHAKRYTTHTMGTEQGKTGGLVGAAVLAEARGERVQDVGLPTFRPFVTPVTWGAIVGARVGHHYAPVRLTPLHDWHAHHGAEFMEAGAWMRPSFYRMDGDADDWASVLREARAVRRAVGICDVSTLGKIDVQGTDAAIFLDRIYTNTMSSLPVGRARYGLMLREDGIVFDDGTVSRLAPDHFFVTTTTANADPVMAHLEFHLQTNWPELDVQLASVTDTFASMSIAGPRARDTLLQAAHGLDLSNRAFPFMAVGEAEVASCPVRVFRISFSGEQAYEVATPWGYGVAVWQAIMQAGAAFGIQPYGVEALGLLRIEKGHVAGPELNGQTTAADLGLGRMLKPRGDFIGRALAERPGMVDPDRPHLVGVMPSDRTTALRAGAHLVVPGSTTSLGWISSVTRSVELERWIGLALLRGGEGRIGTRLQAAFPLKDETAEVEIVSPHFVDPENARVRA